jgi:hypothetical protein
VQVVCAGCHHNRERLRGIQVGRRRKN